MTVIRLCARGQELHREMIKARSAFMGAARMTRTKVRALEDSLRAYKEHFRVCDGCEQR